MHFRLRTLLVVLLMGPLSRPLARSIEPNVRYATPAAVFAAQHEAVVRREWRRSFACFTPAMQEDELFETVFALGLNNSPKAAEITRTFVPDLAKLKGEYAKEYKQKHGVEDRKFYSDRELLCNLLSAGIRDKDGFYEAACDLFAADAELDESQRTGQRNSKRAPPELRIVHIAGDRATGITDAIVVSLESRGDGTPARRVETRFDRELHFRRIDGGWLID